MWLVPDAFWDLADLAQTVDRIRMAFIHLQLNGLLPENPAPGFDRAPVQAGDVEPPGPVKTKVGQMLRANSSGLRMNSTI